VRRVKDWQKWDIRVTLGLDGVRLEKMRPGGATWLAMVGKGGRSRGKVGRDGADWLETDFYNK
jgi:hypothetical protein